jgi:chromosomal replication initiation ATPase DnaA
MPGQLVLPFGVRPALDAEDFIVAPSNEAAFRFVTSWPDWPVRAAALYGPEGSGKTHLAGIWCAKSQAHYVSATQLTLETSAALPQDAHLVVEDLDSVTGEQRDRALFSLLERASGNLLLTARTPPGEWRVSIADLHSRFAALLAFPVWAPDDALLGSLARKLFADRQLQVPDMVIRRLVTALERTPAAISDFVDLLDRKSLAEQRPVSDRLVAELLDQKGPN